MLFLISCRLLSFLACKWFKSDLLTTLMVLFHSIDWVLLVFLLFLRVSKMSLCLGLSLCRLQGRAKSLMVSSIYAAKLMQ